MIVIESLGKVVRLTPEYLSISLSENTIQEIRNLASRQATLIEAVECLLRWVNFPTIWVRDIISVSLETIPATPGCEHFFKLLILAQFRGGQRTYEIRLGPDDAKRIASEIENLIQKRF